MPVDLYNDSTYTGQVMLGNVAAFAAAANFKLRDIGGDEVVALFTFKDQADAALAAALDANGAGSYELLDGPAYDVGSL